MGSKAAWSSSWSDPWAVVIGDSGSLVVGRSVVVHPGNGSEARAVCNTAEYTVLYVSPGFGAPMQTLAGFDERESATYSWPWAKTGDGR